MTTAWSPACHCRCGGSLGPAGWWCAACGRSYDAGDGMLRWLDDATARALRPFLDQYRRVRARDGYRVSTSEYYQRLPVVPSDDPQRIVWRVRQESFTRVKHLLRARFPSGPIRVADLGAGSGWLSARLGECGCSPVATDVLDDDMDGLGAGRLYQHQFPRVVADFDDLPFAVRQFEAVIFNGSLHYAPDVARTLNRAAELLAPGGMLIVADSPMFGDAEAGERMCARNRRRFQQQYGIATPVQIGEGFLTFDGLASVARTLDREAHYFESRGPARWAAHRWLTRVTGGPPAPQFGVWVAT